jgi:hypothetical protein
MKKTRLDPVHAIGLILILAPYLFAIPIISLLARLFFHAFLLGALARRPFGLKGNALLESILLSIGITACAGMMIGNFFAPQDIASRFAMALLALVLFVLNNGRLPVSFERPSREIIYIAVFSMTGIGLMLFLNPYTGFISDGWLHCSILNTIGDQKLPPSNPWLSDASLAYPYAYHVFLSYAFQGELFCLNQFGIFAVLMMFAQALGIYCILLEFGGKKIGVKEALAGSFVFTWASSIGGLVFVWDLLTKVPAVGVSGFLAFLKSVHGPHMWQGAMKFLLPTGLNLPFQGMAMVGSPQLLLVIGIAYFLLKKSETVGLGIKKADVGIALFLAPLCAISSLIGVIAAVALSVHIVGTRWIRGIAPIIFIGLSTVLIDFSFIKAVLGKASMLPGTRAELFSPLSIWTFALLIIGFLPLIILAGIVYGKDLLGVILALFGLKEKPRDKDVVVLSFVLIFSSLAILFIMKFGYLYFTYPLFIGLALLAGPYFAKIELKIEWKSIFLILLLLVLCIPNLLIIGSYVYYKPNLEAEQMKAGYWIKDSTPVDSVFMQNMDLGGNSYSTLCPGGKPRDLLNFTEARQIFVYSSAFGGRRNYIADLRSIYGYGNNFCPELSEYFAIFVDKNADAICGLKKNGVDYLYVTDSNWSAGDSRCLSLVFENEKVRVYETE